MPVEIRELVIRAVTNAETEQADNNNHQADDDCLPSPGSQDAIIETCVQQVLRILKKREER